MKPHGTSPLSASAMPITAHSATSLWRGQHLLHAAGREPVAGDVDDVVGAAHDEQVAVRVLEAGVRGLVVAGELGEVAFLEALVLLPQRRQAGGRQRQLDDDRAHLVRPPPPCTARRRCARRSPASPPSASRASPAAGRAPPDCRRSPSRSRSATSDRSPASSAASRPIRPCPDRRARRRGTGCGISTGRTARRTCPAGPPS